MKRLFWFLMLVMAVGLAFAQAVTYGAAAVDYCLIYGPIVSLVVSLLKRVPWIGKYPKVFAAFLSGVAAILGTLGIGGAVDWAAVIQCAVQTFALSVATYEVVKTPVRLTINNPKPDIDPRER